METLSASHANELLFGSFLVDTHPDAAKIEALRFENDRSPQMVVAQIQQSISIGSPWMFPHKLLKVIEKISKLRGNRVAGGRVRLIAHHTLRRTWIGR
jgi:hypothetical protein